jgi:hypothetical protein
MGLVPLRSVDFGFDSDTVPAGLRDDSFLVRKMAFLMVDLEFSLGSAGPVTALLVS